MTNFEWLLKQDAELVKDCLLGNTNGIAVNCNGHVDECNRMACIDCIFNPSEICKMARMKWLEEEHNPYTIPFDTPVDTKVLVSSDGNTWRKRYFAGFDDRENHYNSPYCTYDDGATSWSIPDDIMSHISHWQYCKLAEENAE